MAARIEDYALIGDCETAALVGRDGSIDWLCVPRFDSDACFAALLGDRGHGRWRIAPADETCRSSRRYLPDTLVLETTFETRDGVVTLTDFMPQRTASPHVVRRVRGEKGRVDMCMELVLRFGYGAAIPWVRRLDDGTWQGVAGPDLVVLRTPAGLRAEGFTTVSEFTLAAGETLSFVLAYGASHMPPPEPIDVEQALQETTAFWTSWAQACNATGEFADAIRRSLITLKALTHAPTGGLIAAPTTSLPERLGGERNWDYRYCWLRDATLTLLALMSAGHYEEARAWTDWLRRAAAGSPADVQVMYGVAGERRLSEWTVDWLPGYEASAPVRIGNAAYTQFQLDVFGELMDAFHQARRGGIAGEETWALQLLIVDHVAKVWDQPDQGVWEVRGPRRHYTFSKAMAWVAFDRAVKSAEEFGLDGPVDDWRALRDRIRADVEANAVNSDTGGFQRAYDDPHPDASLLLLAELGFLKPDDPRFIATVEAVRRELTTPQGFILRYDTVRSGDGLPPGEGVFLPCNFWLASALLMLGRREEGEALFRRLLDLCNDVGLLSEEYSPTRMRLLGNFPQAFTHVALLSAALNLTHPLKPSAQRAEGASTA